MTLFAVLSVVGACVAIVGTLGLEAAAIVPVVGGLGLLVVAIGGLRRAAERRNPRRWLAAWVLSAAVVAGVTRDGSSSQADQPG